MKIKFLPITLLLIALLSVRGESQVFVNDNASGTNDGTSWANAFTDLQSALAIAVAGDEIWVAEGTYKPAGLDGVQTATYLINKDLRLYGGFVGTEASLSERGDPAEHPTILTGDLNGDDVEDDFTANKSDNVLTVMTFLTTVTNECIIDGFAIKGGHADGTASDQEKRGGGLYSEGYPIVQNCRFTANFASKNGGGAYFGNLADAIGHSYGIINCVFEKNHSNESGGGLLVFERGNNSVYLLKDCTLKENDAATDGGGFLIFATASSDDFKLTVDGCSFNANTVGNNGSGLYVGLAGNNVQVEMNRCNFTENVALNFSAAADFWGTAGDNGSVTVDSCHFESNTSKYSGALEMGSGYSGGAFINYTLTNSTILHNTATEGGGLALWCGDDSGGNFLVENCLVESNNGNLRGGGIMFNPSSSNFQATARNTRIVNNQSPSGGGIDSYIFQQGVPFPTGATVLFENCLIADNDSGNAAITSSLLPNLTLLNCTVADNASNGIRLADQSALTLQNTILHNPGFAEYVAATGNVSVTSHSGNLVADNSLAGLLIAGDKQGLEPLFVNSSDYHLQVGSPCVDAGNSDNVTTTEDLNGDPRVQGGRVDMGAYESPFVSSAIEVLMGEITVLPNPVNSLLNLQLPGLISGPINVQVLDAQGRLALLASRQSLDVQRLAPGIYSLRVAVGERVYVGKFIKQ